MKQVPLSGRVILCDSHGVLSRAPFWMSIRSRVTHPLHTQLEAGMAELFASDRHIADEWMKGLLSSSQRVAGDSFGQLPAQCADSLMFV